MKKGICYFVFMCHIIIFHQAHADDSVNKIYQMDNSVSCGTKKFNIPSYFPYLNKNSIKGTFLTATCTESNIYVYIGLSDDCKGEHVCTEASYFSEKVSAIISNKLEQGFASAAKSVEFGEKQIGYFLPAKCFAYCTDSQFIWFSDNRINIIGTKNAQISKENILELKKSAESLWKDQHK
jgi:hypothetical protein